MPINRNALIRYRAIDNCLRNRYRQWTLEDLIEVCSETLYEYEGIEKGVSKRTVQMDLQMMRSDKLGYNAPIVVIDKKYYTYEDPDYSITNIPLTDQDLNKLTEAIDFLRQFKGFSHFRELEGMVQKLEDHVHSQKHKQSPVIDFEKNEGLKGLEFLDQLYQTIIQKRSIVISYQSFKARESSEFIFHPYLLKEFRNRWFVIGKRQGQKELLNLALDRISGLDRCDEALIETPSFDPAQYFNEVIGVSVSSGLRAEEVILFVNSKHAPYVMTKPLHHSQKVIEQNYYGITLSLKVQHNYELEKEILAFGDGIKVVAPERLKRNVKSRLQGGLDLYNTELSESGLTTMKRRLTHKGTAVLNRVYTVREANHIKRLIEKKLGNLDQTHACRSLFKRHPELSKLVINPNLREIIATIDPKAFLVKAIYFNKTPQANWYVSWHQDMAINVNDKVPTEGFTAWTFKEGIHGVLPPAEVNKNTFTLRVHLDNTDAGNGCLKVLPGSHNQRFSNEEIALITANSSPVSTELYAGGVHVMKPLLLHASSENKSGKNRRVIHLEFSSSELPGELDWAERMEV